MANGSGVIGKSEIDKLLMFFGKLMIAMVPIIGSFVGRLGMLPKAEAKKELYTLQAFNFSMDLLVTAFGILAGLVFFKATESKATTVRAAILLFVGLSLVLILRLWGPHLDLYQADNVWFTMVLPNLVGLAVLSLSIGEEK